MLTNSHCISYLKIIATIRWSTSLPKRKKIRNRTSITVCRCFISSSFKFDNFSPEDFPVEQIFRVAIHEQESTEGAPIVKKRLNTDLEQHDEKRKNKKRLTLWSLFAVTATQPTEDNTMSAQLVEKSTPVTSTSLDLSGGNFLRRSSSPSGTCNGTTQDETEVEFRGFLR